MAERFDASWRKQALAGEPAAIQSLADHVLRPLYSFCYYRVGCNPDLCEEVVQETLLAAIQRLDRYDPGRTEGVIFGWLTGLARNEIRRALGRSRTTVCIWISSTPIGR